MRESTYFSLQWYLLPSKNTKRIINKLDKSLSLSFSQNISTVEEPSSGQSRTQPKYTASAHSKGSHIVYSDILKLYFHRYTVQ